MLQEEYKPTLANLLSLPTHLIGSKRRVLHTLPAFTAPTQEIAESVLVKTLLEKPEWIDFTLEYIDISLFAYKREEFAKLLQQEVEHPLLIAIAINEKIKPLNDLLSLKEHLRLFIIQAYTQFLSQIPRFEAMSLQEKGALIKEVKTKILQLKKGELLPYVSFSTF